MLIVTATRTSEVCCLCSLHGLVSQFDQVDSDKVVYEQENIVCVYVIANTLCMTDRN
jgi:hypothetical protein